MNLVSRKHAINFSELILKNQMGLGEIEKLSLFYIIAGNEDLFSKKDYIYDFENGEIKPEVLTDKKIDLCSSSKALIRLGFNLFNGYEDKHTNPIGIFNKLDKINLQVAQNAIGMRLDEEFQLPNQEVSNEEDEIEEYEYER